MRRAVKDLTPHPDNALIYGDTPAEDLIDSIRQKGVMVALIITRQNVIISGHRRWQAAMKVGLTDVPVSVFGSDDPLDVLEALIHANMNRVKTNEQLAREAQKIWDVKEGRARQRQQDLAGTRLRASVDLQAPVPEGREGSKGQTRDQVGQELNIGGKTAERAKRVADILDQLQADGRSKEAEEVRSVLNSKGVGPAYKLATTAPNAKEETLVPLPPQSAERNLELVAAADEITRLRSQMLRLRQAIYQAMGRPGAAWLMIAAGQRQGKPYLECLEDLLAVLWNSVPLYDGCPGCQGGRECSVCKGHQFLPRGLARQLSKEQRDRLPRVKGAQANESDVDKDAE